VPFFGADLVRLALIVLFPSTVLFLPDYMDQIQDQIDTLIESLF
jgi:hypothetical protein